MKSGQIVNLIQVPDEGKGHRYQVKSLTNRLEPRIGKFLSDAEVKRLIDTKGIKVNIVGRA